MHRVCRLVTAMLLVGVVVLGGRADAQDGAGSPKALLQPTEEVVFRADWGDWLGFTTTATASTKVLVPAAIVGSVRVHGFHSDGTPLQDLTVTPRTGEAPAAVLEIRFVTKEGRRIDGWLVVGATSPQAPETIPFTVKRVIRGGTLVKPLIGALVIPIGFLLLRHASLRERFKKKGKELTLTHLLEVDGANWSFSESWASNITAVGAILGTVLASTDFVTEALSGLTVSGFLALSFAFALLALLAPVAFNAFSRDGKGTYGGLMLAAAFTAGAVVGQLSTLGIMLHRGGLPLIFGFAATMVTWSVLGLYVWRSIGDLVQVPGAVGTPKHRYMSRSSAIL